MATASKIHLTPRTTGVFHVDGITEESARVASELLQENHEKHHMYFNDKGFHNHIAHHVLTLFSLGATAEQLRKAYANNITYQRPQRPIDTTVRVSLSDESTFRSYLGKEQYYHSFLSFYEDEIQKNGWEKTLQEHVFRKPGEDGGRAQELFTRLYAGFFHPLIHLGFGISFEQPAIVAEALAQAATHKDYHSSLLLSRGSSPARESPSLFTLLSRVQQSEPLRESAKRTDPRNLDAEAVTRGLQDLISICTDYHVPANASAVKKAMAEMTSLNGYFTLTSLRLDKIPKVDFFYMHCLNCSLFFRDFDRLPENVLSLENKARLLESKAKMDFATYVLGNCPPLRVSELEQYAADGATKEGIEKGGWDDLFKAVNGFEDDGHTSKLIRAIASAAEVCGPYEETEGWPLKGQDWLRAGKMVMDSVKAPGETWVFLTGYEEAWIDIPARKKMGTSPGVQNGRL